MILAIDPGTEQSAFVIMDPETRVIALKGIFYNDDIMQSVIYYNLDKYDRAAIEMIASYGMPVGKEVFETCVWIGKFMQLLSSNNKPVNLVYRKDVKMHLCGSTRAKDANIRQALIDLLGKEKTKGVSKDMWAALGVAVTVAGIQ